MARLLVMTTSSSSSSSSASASPLSPLVGVSTWESSVLGKWPDYPEVCENLADQLVSHGVRVFYVCGADHATKCGLYMGMGARSNVGVVVINRAGGDERGETAAAAADGVYVMSGDSVDLSTHAASSSAVQRALGEENWDAAEEMVGAAVLEYIQRNNLYGVG